MTCPFYRKLCGSCKKYVCRAYFPEKQPYIKNDMLPLCTGDNYEHECLIYPDAVTWHEERMRKSLNEHCPFAANAFCGKPWLWMCKGAVPPFALTDVETDGRGIAIHVEGNLVYKSERSVSDIKDTCLSGKMDVYKGCPSYKEGMAFRESAKKLKKEGII